MLGLMIVPDRRKGPDNCQPYASRTSGTSRAPCGWTNGIWLRRADRLRLTPAANRMENEKLRSVATEIETTTVAMVFGGGLGLAAYHAGTYQAYAERLGPLHWVAG